VTLCLSGMLDEACLCQRTLQAGMLVHSRPHPGFISLSSLSNQIGMMAHIHADI
jgi:hypothetical protein